MPCEYRLEWTSLPEFSSWLQPDPSSTSHALCFLCNLQIKANLAHLRRHAAARHVTGAPHAPPQPRTSRPPSHVKYNPDWRKRPELSAWLRRSPRNPDSAFCLACNKELRPALDYLRRHAVCSLHERRSRRPAAARPGASSALTANAAVTSASVAAAADADLNADADADVDADVDTRDGDKDERRGAESIETWERQAELAPWLRPSAADWRKAFCLFCYKELTAKLTHVRRHAASARHIRRAATATQVAATAVEASATPAEKSSSPAAVPGNVAGGIGGAAYVMPDLETVEACDSDTEWSPDREADALSAGAAADHEFRPVLQPRDDAVFSPAPAPSPGPGGDAGSGGGGEGGGSAPARSTDHAVYNPAWERRPELAGWISRGPDRPRHAYCLVCRVEITPKLAHVRRHGTSQRHVRNAQEAEQLAEVGQLDVVLSDNTQQSASDLGTRAFVVETGLEADAGAFEDGTCERGAENPADEDWTLTEGQHEPNPDDPGHKTPQQTQDEAEPETGQPSGPRRLLAYQTLWEEVPELRDWLGRSPWDERRPFCRWCRREVTAKLAHLRRHARCGLHRRARPSTEGRAEREMDRRGVQKDALEVPDIGSETDGGSGAEKMTQDSCQPAEFGPFGTCLICKHPLVVRLNIFRSRTKPSLRLVASVLSALVQQPLTEECSEPSSSEICTSCASLLDTADELQTKLTAVENEVKLKFKTSCPLTAAPQSSWDEATPVEDDERDSAQQPATEGITTEETVTAQGATEPFQQGDMVLEGEPVAYITIGDADQDNSAIVVRTETLENGDLVIYREPVELAEAEPPVNMFSDSLVQAEDPPQEAPPEADSHLSEPASPLDRPDHRGSGDGRRRRPATGRPPGDQRTFDCVFCHCSFRTSLALHHHWNTEHPLQLRPCPHCPKRFLYNSSLKQHIRTHEARCYTCDQCGRQFAANCDLKKHTMFVHSEVRRYPCEVCGKAFKLHWMLGRHVRLVHEDEES